MASLDRARGDFDFDQRLDIHTNTIFDKIILSLSSLLFFTVIVLLAIQVTVRTIPTAGFGPSAFWTETGARMCLIIGTYIGAAVCSRNDEHIRIKFILDKIESRAPLFRDTLDVIGKIVVVTTLLIVTYATGLAIVSGWTAGMVGGLPFTIGHIQAAITIGFFAMLIYEINNSFSAAKVFRNKWGSSE